MRRLLISCSMLIGSSNFCKFGLLLFLAVRDLIDIFDANLEVVWDCISKCVAIKSV